MSVVAARGYRAAGVWAAIKGSGKPDLTLLVSDRPAAAAGVFTANRFRAAPVVLSAARLKATGGRARAIVATSGCANALTGAAGERDARAIGREAARLLGVREPEVLLASTGTIGTRLPVDRVRRGLRKAVRALAATEAAGAAAARGILTTDTRPKLAEARFSHAGVSYTIGGIAKGVGMVAPHMATVLVFLTTDAAVAPEPLRRALARAAARTFNTITVDAQMSTNDTAFLIANGAAGGSALRVRGVGAFQEALEAVCGILARELVRDGEGARHVIEVRVRGAQSREDAERAARTVADSPLMKTMFHGRQPNWGRLAQALGASGARFDPRRIVARVAGVPALRGGRVVPPAFGVLTRLAAPEIAVDVDLRAGRHAARVLGCDLTEAYVRINAGYLS